MGPRTLSSPIYRRLGELLTAMQPLFQRLNPQAGAQRLHQPLTARSKVLVKAQIYEVRSGEEILGEIHQEGTPSDQIQMVGLFYPAVEDTLEGGDLEITVVMTGGCGSQYPVSRTIPVQAGTAIAFDNHAAYHRMSTLRASPGQRGRRLVVAFFVLQDLAPPGVPCTDTVCVNYADKARSLVRRMLGQPTPKLPKHIQLRIEHFLTGGDGYALQRFNACRRARAHPVTQEGLAIRAMD
ncbi:clpB2 [Symbiodinium pilosum]|uniref:ClpB2 protein n=1 Tax=Symbiodinium pilosum TaxID=2952 RepID=A0A812X136_SYMPI|nr:clpB2 [Symbiodinium pilosum]